MKREELSLNRNSAGKFRSGVRSACPIVPRTVRDVVSDCPWKVLTCGVVGADFRVVAMSSEWFNERSDSPWWRSDSP